ncbi:MAG: hypothetical protein CMP59_10510 [Flavobacteriales bacterium]|nr:hypothetical protein [Flavobacteriales bacterium]|tara:strand:- start:24 stop:461 length:438 start_codon:yes stop_codon:yes gene_type:complete
MTEFFKITGLLLFSALKFFLAPATVLISGYDIWETILITSIGGVGGFLTFYFFGSLFYKKYREFFPPKRKRIFTPRKRKMVKYKNKYGFWGLAILTPVLFGIPLGSLVAAAFFPEKGRTIGVFVSSIIVWSILISLQCAYLKSIW